MSLSNFPNVDEAVGEIRRRIKTPLDKNRIWVFVEGIDDIKLFSKLIDGPEVELQFVGGGKSSLLKTVSELLKLTRWVIGIRDADFLHLEGQTETPENIFLTDYHDSEMMLIACDKAYQHVAAEYVDKSVDPFILRENILKSITFIGGLRWLNTNNSDVEAESLSLNFKKLGLSDYYNPKTFQFNEEKYLQVIMQRSAGKKKTILITEVKDKIKNVSALYNLCNGKDFIHIFALHVAYKEINRVFRVIYNREDFQQTQLYQQLQAWSNSQSKVLFRNN